MKKQSMIGMLLLTLALLVLAACGGTPSTASSDNPVFLGLSDVTPTITTQDITLVQHWKAAAIQDGTKAHPYVVMASDTVPRMCPSWILATDYVASDALCISSHDALRLKVHAQVFAIDTDGPAIEAFMVDSIAPQEKAVYVEMESCITSNCF